MKFPLLLCALLQAAPATAPNSADRMLFWLGAEDVVPLSDADLDQWKSRGVGGFICVTRHLTGGATSRFTSDPKADLAGKQFTLQKAFRDSRVVARAKARGMKMYLGFYAVNYYNTATPLAEWFDDAGWSKEVIPRAREFAAAARLLGFDGVAIDEELYPQTRGAQTTTWNWNYPGNTHTEPEVRAKAVERGRQFMAALVEGHGTPPDAKPAPGAPPPGLEIIVYDYLFPDTWQAVVQKVVNKKEGSGKSALFLDFWDGMTSAEGYDAIRFMNATFYKGTHVGGWDAALQYDMNSFFSLLSRRFSNWSYASSHVFQSPFSWINAGPRPGYEAARPPEFVATQLAMYKKWGMGGEFANFCFGGLHKGFDYTPYLAAMQATAKPETVDSQPPRLEFTAPTQDDSYKTTERTVRVTGFATDNLAIRAVRWKSDHGSQGAAPMTWVIKSGDPRKGCDWQMDWSIEAIPLVPGANQIVVTVEDIKGLTTTKTLIVQRK